MNKLGYLAIVIGLAAAACGGDSTTPTASGVFPANGFAGRTVRVEISGDATNWTDGATVDFGTGITASNVTVASPTDIFADIAIDPAATAGLSDVTVTSGGTFTLKQAFEVDAPIDIATSGTVAQGSLPILTITNHDSQNPFDSTSGTDPNTGNTIFPNINITGPAGVTFVVNSVTDFSISVFCEIDVDASAGGVVTVTSGAPTGTQVSSQSSLTIMARTATQLTSGTAATGTIEAANNTYLYKISAAANPSEIDFAVPAPSDPNALLTVYVLGSSGHWADFVTTNLEQTFFGDIALQSFGLLDTTGGDYYAVVLDAGADSGYSYSLTGHTAAFTDVAEAGADAGSTVGTAQAVAEVPGLVTPATIGTSDAGDWYKFTTGVQGMYVHAVTFGDNGTDTALEIDDGATCAAANALTFDVNGDPGAQDNVAGPEDAVGGSLTGTTFCVKVTQGGQYSSANTDYKLAVWLEAAE